MKTKSAIHAGRISVVNPVGDKFRVQVDLGYQGNFRSVCRYPNYDAAYVACEFHRKNLEARWLKLTDHWEACK